MFKWLKQFFNSYAPTDAVFINPELAKKQISALGTRYQKKIQPETSLIDFCAAEQGRMGSLIDEATQNGKSGFYIRVIDSKPHWLEKADLRAAFAKTLAPLGFNVTYQLPDKMEHGEYIHINIHVAGYLESKK